MYVLVSELEILFEITVIFEVASVWILILSCVKMPMLNGDNLAGILLGLLRYPSKTHGGPIPCG